MGRLRQAPPLAGLPPAHGTFQGHAAHPTERPVVLSPNDAWGAWTPAWDYLTCCLVPSSIPKPRLMAHCSVWLGRDKRFSILLHAFQLSVEGWLRSLRIGQTEK
jgi:hypothetical protein